MSGTGNGDALKIQQQVRENAEELGDFLRGFSAWRKEMQQKDEQLLEASRQKKKRNLEIAARSSPLPPEPKPRKLSSPPAPNVPSPMKIDVAKSQKKIKASDYDAWSKFDVDKACEEVDNQVKAPPPSTPVPQATSSHMKQRAVAEKDRGNEYFKKGKYHEAIKCYSDGIQCDPTNAILPANRAMASLKLGLFSSAEDDCTLAISLDHTYVKAFQRRASARASLKRYQLAINDWLKVLEMEKSNTQARTEIEKLKVLSQSANEEEKKKSQKLKTKADHRVSFEDNIKTAFKSEPKFSKEIKNTLAQIIQPISKPPQQRSKRPLKRIEIEEVSDDAFGVAKREIETKNASGDFMIREVSTKSGKPKVEEVKLEKLKIEEVSSTETGEPSMELETAEPTKSKGLVKKVEEDILKTADSKKAKKNKLSESLKNVTSSVGFINFWKSLSSPEDKFEFLDQKMKQSETYPKLFRSSLESWIFEDVVDVLHKFRESHDLSGHIYGLSIVPRIAAIVMFMDDKSKLNDLVNSVLQKRTLITSKIESIKKNLR